MITLTPKNFTERRTHATHSSICVTVEELAGNASLASPQQYIASDAEAKRRVVALIKGDADHLALS